MRSRGRPIAALALALACAPGNILRTEVPDTLPEAITLDRIGGASATANPQWRVEGVWQYSADSLNFGGYSALLTLPDNRLRAFSDRGHRFTFLEPDQPGADTLAIGRVERQLVEPGYFRQLWDIEAAARDPATGEYWLAFENYHAIQRYSASSAPQAMHRIDEARDWYVNAGAEAMARLEDGRFVIVAEGRGEGLLYPSDPVAGAEAQVFAVESPIEGYVVTDMAQLPDGRLLLLLRDVVAAWPPFSCFLALAEPPTGAPDEVWRPQLALWLDGVIPAENYEGLAVRPREDGTVAVWLIADDNLSVIQRSLLARLVFNPAAKAP